MTPNLITEYNKLRDKDKAISMLKEIKLANRKVGPVLSKENIRISILSIRINY